MNLSEINPVSTAKKMNKIMESRFGFGINYDTLTIPQAKRLSKSIAENLTRIKHSFGSHTAERNPKYMELLLVREGLQRWLGETRRLMEGEMGKSEAILAAKDMVDSIQDMVEKVSKMQAEQMPALIDTIRDQIGMQEADQFKNSVGQLLTDMAAKLGQARESADVAARQLAGEQMGAGGMEMPGSELAAPETSDFDSEEPEAGEGDAFAASDAAVGGNEPLGREQR